MVASSKIVLLDTNVVSYRHGNTASFDRFRPHMAEKIAAISFATYGEVMTGAYKAEWGPRRLADLQTHLRSYLIIPADRELADRFARLKADTLRRGVALGGDNDYWIGATALRYELPLLTNDSSFRSIRGLTILPAETDDE